MEWVLIALVAISLIVYLVVEHKSDKAFDRLCDGIISSTKKDMER